MPKIRKITLPLLLSITLISGASCASHGGDDFSNQQTRKEMTITRGAVSDVREVTTSNSSTGVGVIAGGLLGGVLGHQIGGGSARSIGAVGGALGGAAVGAGAEKTMRDTKALELTIKLDNGQEVVIVQEADQNFSVGDRVRVLRSSDGLSRVQPE